MDAEFGIAFQTDKPPGAYGPLAAAAEAYGFDVVTVFADLLYQPPLPPLLEIARATSRVRLGAACFNPYTLHPYEIAGQVAALDAASAGRAYLGLARGAWLGAIGITQSRPLRRLREAAAVARALLAGDEAGIAGQEFRLEPGTRLRAAPPSRVPPLLPGAWGPRGRNRAGLERLVTTARERYGRLDVLFSTAAYKVVPAQAVYAATKTAVKVLTEGLRQEAGPNLRVTLISPGWFTNTEGVGKGGSPEVAAALIAQRDAMAMPPDAIARAAAFAIEQPESVDVGEIVVQPTAQG